MSLLQNWFDLVVMAAKQRIFLFKNGVSSNSGIFYKSVCITRKLVQREAPLMTLKHIEIKTLFGNLLEFSRYMHIY